MTKNTLQIPFTLNEILLIKETEIFDDLTTISNKFNILEYLLTNNIDEKEAEYLQEQNDVEYDDACDFGYIEFNNVDVYDIIKALKNKKLKTYKMKKLFKKMKEIFELF